MYARHHRGQFIAANARLTPLQFKKEVLGYQVARMSQSGAMDGRSPPRAREIVTM
jgi:hypothetical protein